MLRMSLHRLSKCESACVYREMIMCLFRKLFAYGSNDSKSIISLNLTVLCLPGVNPVKAQLPNTGQHLC